MNYWGYRTNKHKTKFFAKELNQGRLRQGWGYEESQNLRNDMLIDGGARRNKRMFNQVKKGDVLLVPHLPEYNSVAIVEATKDWDEGYRFEIDKEEGDYGHIFPAKFVKKFTKKNKNVSADIQTTLKNKGRFWNINHCQDGIEKLLESCENDLLDKNSCDDRIEEALLESFDEKKFSETFYNKLNENFANETWEDALVSGLQELLPFYFVERIGGKEEKHHGTDILIKLPGIDAEYSYAIAIQVKDYKDIVKEHVCEQIAKADKYDWEGKYGVKLIDKIVVVIKATENENEKLIRDYPEIRFVFAGDLREILCKIGKKLIGKTVANGEEE